MTFANPLIAAGVAGLCDLYADRAVTPVEACEAYLSRIAGLDGALGAYVHVDEPGALAAAHASAERWREGRARSMLDGTPVSVKANVAVEGWPWHAGIGAYRDRTAQADAELAARLREAGAVLLGLTNMHEGALGATGDNPHFGPTHNPWSFERVAGGSSSGAGAAVAAGLCAAAIGTDTLGSVRIPAAFCGVVGHKPTPGLAPTGGIVPMSWTLDQPGVLARSATDAARVFGAMCAAEPELAADIAEPASPEALAEAPLAVLATGVPLGPEAQQALDSLRAQARAAGLDLAEAELDVDLARVRRCAMFVAAAESAAEHEEALAETPSGFSSAYTEALRRGGERPARELAAAYRELAEAGEAIRDALSPYAAVLLPATPVAPFPLGAPQPEATSQLTTLASVAGLPATAFPMGLDDGGLPRAVQAVAWDDETCLGLARLLCRDPGDPPAYRG